MTTLNTKLSEALIKRTAKSSPDITKLKDPRYPVILKFHKSRERGSWYYVSKNRWKKVGEWPRVSLEHIAEGVPEIELNLACGSPLETAVIRHWSSVGEMLNWYVNDKIRVKKITSTRKATIKSAVKCHLNPLVGRLQVETLNKALIDSCLMLPLQEKGLSDSFIKLIFGILKSAYREAYELDLLSHNPVSGFQLKHFGKFTIKPKASAIKEHDIASVIEVITSAAPQSRLLSVLMLLYGTRIGETRRATWDDIDFAGRMWRIPAHTTKTGVALNLPLSVLAVRELGQYKRWQSKRYTGKYIFHKSPRKPLTPTQANDVIKEVSGQAWTAHDLRKAFKTAVIDLGIDKWLVDILVNHKLTELDVTYIHSKVEPLKLNAITTYHEWLSSRSNRLSARDHDEI
ncbi:tyrosine-type recombinase/integrase [Vibrio hannami]|uniref:tyrosine-type recombinase/integrase n=1 Tax=Vibrio hannami TaxID=2717094 RepID=UPI00240EF70A|nr:tyrosine-type recombinase/integrase [Vibrio hannami]MDG3089165.1 tyrosine-type recombinase/integrase [Vibrio hannami]